MKVCDLIEELKQLDPDMEVVMSSDAEGNSYSPLSGYGVGYYVKENSWSGEWWDEDDLSPLDFDEEKDYYDIVNQDKAIALFPVN